MHAGTGRIGKKEKQNGEEKKKEDREPVSFSPSPHGQRCVIKLH